MNSSSKGERGEGSPRRGNSSKGGDSVEQSLEGGEGELGPRRGGVLLWFAQISPSRRAKQAAASQRAARAMERALIVVRASREITGEV